MESLRLFSLKGFAATAVSDIMEAAHTSKGGFYNHFATKEHLFHAVMAQARKIWRQANLHGLHDIESPLGKIKKLLENYRTRYLIDNPEIPGGCIFVTLSVELDDQFPHLAQEVDQGYIGLKRMLQRLLDQAKTLGELQPQVDTGALAELIFAVILGASVIHGSTKSPQRLALSLGAVVSYLDLVSATPSH